MQSMNMISVYNVIEVTVTPESLSKTHIHISTAMAFRIQVDERASRLILLGVPVDRELIRLPVTAVHSLNNRRPAKFITRFRGVCRKKGSSSQRRRHS